MTSKLNAKLAEPFFLFRRKVAFDGMQIELMAHLMKVSVREKSINRQIQSGDSIGNTSAPTLERLLDRNELIGESKSRNRTPSVNSKNDLPVLSVKHDSQVKGRCRYYLPPSTAPLNKGVACPLIKTTTPAPNTLGYVWAMPEALSRYRASAMRGFISGAKRTSQGTTVEGMIQHFAEISI